jgi:hypothetical protein
LALQLQIVTRFWRENPFCTYNKNTRGVVAKSARKTSLLLENHTRREKIVASVGKK